MIPEALNERLRAAKLDPARLCEEWDRVRLLAVDDDPTDLASLARTVEERQQTVLQNEPILGAPRWLVEEVIPLGGQCYAVLMNDGHIENCALVLYCEGKLSLLAESTGA